VASVRGKQEKEVDATYLFWWKTSPKIPIMRLTTANLNCNCIVLNLYESRNILERSVHYELNCFS